MNNKKIKNYKEWYWKVLHINPDKTLRSAIIKKGVCCVNYQFGKIITSPLNGLLVFETRKQARLFIRNNYSYRPAKVFKVKVYGEEIENPPFYYPAELEDFNFVEDLVASQIKEFPDGTHSFPSLEIIEKAR